ncbi:hypothetical protein [Arthrobacter sp. JSM 101049]|uniref:hypothetical protein n=1 Tax=Arthrobacter sp. JSM 101049 TaxID=929097 RepID=UPI003564F556
MAMTFAGAEPGQWIADALAGILSQRPPVSTAAAQIPAGYPAYARIFHPAADEDGRPVRWADIAAERGTTFHAGAQFAALSGLDESGLPWTEDAWSGEPPSGDGLPAADLAAVADTISHHAGPGAYLALWDGYAFIRGGEAVEVLSMEEPATDPEAAEREQVLRDQLKRPAFTRDVLEAGKLELGPQGYRAFYVFSGTLEDVAAPLWKSGDGFAERQAPNLAWGADHSWMFSTELYEDSTIIGGPAELVRELTGDPRIEARALDLQTDLGLNGDRINPAPELDGY